MRRYKQPPITEAVCEFRFDPSSPWDLTIPGLVYDQLRESFPNKRQASVLESETASFGAQAQVKVQASGRSQFLSADEKTIVSVGTNVLAVSRLEPYRGWQEFLPTIQHALDAYRKVSDPKGINRVGLRYVNQIHFSQPKVDLETFFNFYPFVGKKLPADFVRFVVGIETPASNGRDLLRLTMMTVPPAGETKFSVLLDLDYFLAQPASINLDEVQQWLDMAHGAVGATFEGCIRDSLRAQFGEIGGDAGSSSS